MQRIFITGASGFIGSHVVRRLDGNRRFSLSALYRKPGSAPAGVREIIGDLGDPGSYRDVLLESEACVHLAGTIGINSSLESPRQRIEENMHALLNMLEVVRLNGKTPLIVFASTDRVYGRTRRRRVAESEPPRPIEPYTASKMVCETILETYSLLYGIPFIVLRLDSVYGPRQPRSMFISDVIQKMLESDEITTGTLNVRKNFVYVDDVAYAVERSLLAPPAARNQVYNIGGPSASLSSVLSTIRGIIERRRKATIRVRSKRDDRPAAVEVRPFSLSTDKARRFLKWQPRTTLKAGLEATIDYFNSHYA